MAVGLNKGEASEVWDRQPGEGARAYAAFIAYRDLGPERSITKVVQEWHARRSRSRLALWSRQWAWVERASAWDHAERVRDEEARRTARHQAIREMEERHVAIARAVQAKVIERLATIDTSAVGLSALTTSFATAVKVERLALGVSTERVENTPLPPEHVGVFDDEVLKVVAEDPEIMDQVHQLMARIWEKQRDDSGKWVNGQWVPAR